MIALALVLRIGIKPTLSGLLPLLWYLLALEWLCMSQIGAWFQRRRARRRGEAFVEPATYAASGQSGFDLVGVVWFALASLFLTQKLADLPLVIAAVGALVGILAVVRFATFSKQDTAAESHAASSPLDDATSAQPSIPRRVVLLSAGGLAVGAVALPWWAALRPRFSYSDGVRMRAVRWSP